MAITKRTVGHAIGLSIAVLYTLAGQAHFTDRFTPGLAANVEKMTPRSHQAFWFLNLSYDHVSDSYPMPVNRPAGIKSMSLSSSNCSEFLTSLLPCCCFENQHGMRGCGWLLQDSRVGCMESCMRTEKSARLRDCSVWQFWACFFWNGERFEASGISWSL